MPQLSIPAVYMRGGTSKGVFLQEELLPPPGEERDALFLEIIGSPDPMQIDGMGGTVSSTSKVMVISKSTRADCDIDYLFGQVAIDKPVVNYRGNCGNLTAAVGAYAIDEGLVENVQEPVTSLTLFNKNTGVRVRTHIPVANNRAAVQGDHQIAGVPRPGARIVNEYLDPAGSVFDTLLPTGKVRETIETPDGDVEVSIVDAANPVMFLAASTVGLDGDELPPAINQRADVLAHVERIRAACAVRLGLVDRAEDAASVSPVLPVPSLVSAAGGYTTAQGVELATSDMDLRARAFSLQKMHHAYPGTALICTSAAARVPGTIVNEVAAGADDGDEVRIAHPKGVAEGAVKMDLSGDDPHVVSVSITRTARRLMAGEIYYRAKIGNAAHEDNQKQAVAVS